MFVYCVLKCVSNVHHDEGGGQEALLQSEWWRQLQEEKQQVDHNYLYEESQPPSIIFHSENEKLPLNLLIVKLRRGSGKDRQGMAVKAKGLKA